MVGLVQGRQEENMLEDYPLELLACSHPSCANRLKIIRNGLIWTHLDVFILAPMIHKEIQLHNTVEI